MGLCASNQGHVHYAPENLLKQWGTTLIFQKYLKRFTTVCPAEHDPT